MLIVAALLLPLARLRQLAAMSSPCRHEDRYETREEALGAIGMHELVAQLHQCIGSFPVARCNDCDGYRTWPYLVRASD